MTTGDFFKDTVFSRPNPFALMLCAVFVGLFFGLFKDTFKMTERLFGKNGILLCISDFFAVLLSYIFVFVCALHFNHGIIRWYNVVMFASGVFLYKKTLSSIYIFLLDKIFDIIEKTIKFAVMAIMYPVKRIVVFVMKLYVKLQKIVLKYIQTQKFNSKCAKYYKSASLGFGLLPNEKGERKYNVKKTLSSCDSVCDSSSDNFSIQTSDGA